VYTIGSIGHRHKLQKPEVPILSGDFLAAHNEYMSMVSLLRNSACTST
jgi:hypothetical protein